ncbi:MAG: hypothetical protein K2N16_07815 [Muribaculaceae bacterium]|nr:hypothetical protein [Muribaculaceae bacterium]
MKHILLIAIALCVIAAASARRQNTTRTRLQPIPTEASAVYDTIPADSLVVLSGYEKALRSSRESLLITNLRPDTIAGIGVTVEYLDAKGRQLHKRAVEIEAEVPPAETRIAAFESWDKQKVWYYVLSAPARPSAPATPYTVNISIDHILLRK